MTDPDAWLPATELTIDAWENGQGVAGAMTSNPARWAFGAKVPATAGVPMIPAPDAPGNWRDPRVGWGLVLPKTRGLTAAELATAADAPEPIQALVDAREGARVLRYDVAANGAMTVTDYAAGRGLSLTGTKPGNIPGELPMYLLLYGEPATLPWSLQYALHGGRYVGRLHLAGEPLENYVNALLGDWKDSAARYAAPLVWATDHGPADITGLMRAAVASRVAATMRTDADITDLAYLAGSGVLVAYDHAGTPVNGAATIGGLRDRLAAARPAIVVTTSHGQTGPLDDAAAMGDTLGLLLDQQHALVDPHELLATWQPDGAIWYAHACASAGGDGVNPFADLVDAGTRTGRVLDGVAALGPRVGALPTALLGAPRPLRAFVGHVHPTFDWTLRMDSIRGHTTAGLVSALYNGLCGAEPVGMAMDRLYREAGPRWQQRWTARGEYDRTGEERYLWEAMYAGLTALDRAMTVILGDPTATIPNP
ncbi:hypothetical protein [Hamadaea tsunoensis]|uniref:hypothetical protein n=1 Tax=Hamadaea tsunoensis TaxID=53368 RepID=UPI00041B9899|nr:hypothetical protein [Hamadaea tsunoensis]